MESSHEFNETFSNFKDDTEKIVKNTEIKYLSAISAGTNAIKFANSLRKLPLSTFLGSGKIVKGQQFVQSFKSMKKYFVRSTENSWLQTKNPFSTPFSKITASWKNSAIGVHLSKVAKGVKFFSEFTPFFFDIGIGIYKVLEGKKALNSGFIRNLFLTKRKMRHETDSLYDAFYQISGIEKKDYVPMSDQSLLFSLRVHTELNNMDLWGRSYGSYVEFLLKTYDVKGKLKSTCKTNSLKLYNGWNNFDMGKDLGKCWDLEIVNSNLTVTVITGNSLKIPNLQVAVDGNFLPTLDIKQPIDLRGQQSEEIPLEVMKGLKRIKTHTSPIWGAGTDAWVSVQLEVPSDKDMKSPWIELDNEGNDREKNQTDIYEGGRIWVRGDSTYQNLRSLLSDIENFPWGEEIILKLKLEYYLSIPDQWNTDLIKVYYAGEDGKDNVMRCHAGEKWVAEGVWPLKCKLMKPNNPKRSLQKIRAHTCNHYWAGSESVIKFHICKNARDFFGKESGNSDAFEDGRCCKTNLFGIAHYKNQYFDIDHLHNGLDDDGGEQLGACEYFDLSNTTKIFTG